MPLRKPTMERWQRVRDLLSPFYFLTEDCGASWQQDANWDWHQNNSIGAPDELVGTYGSFQDFDIHWTLREILQDEEFYYDPEITFAELSLDFATRPYWASPDWDTTRFEKMVKSLLWYQNSEAAFKPIANMKLIDWWTELRSLLDWQHTGCEETWT